MLKTEFGKHLRATLMMLFFLPAIAMAGEAQPMAADPKLEKKVLEITSELRCLKCQNQTIADSKAGLADDLKEKVREMVAQGKSKEEVKTYMTERYGDFVLYRPEFKPSTTLLWIGPFIFIIAGIIGMYFVFKGRKEQLANSEGPRIDDDRLQKIIDGEKKVDG